MCSCTAALGACAAGACAASSAGALVAAHPKHIFYHARCAERLALCAPHPMAVPQQAAAAQERMRQRIQHTPSRAQSAERLALCAAVPDGRAAAGRRGAAGGGDAGGGDGRARRAVGRRADAAQRGAPGRRGGAVRVPLRGRAELHVACGPLPARCASDRELTCGGLHRGAWRAL